MEKREKHNRREQEEEKKWNCETPKEKKTGGCYQWVYCNECLAFDICDKPEKWDWMNEALAKDVNGNTHDDDCIIGSGSINDLNEILEENKKWEEEKKKNNKD